MSTFTVFFAMINFHISAKNNFKKESQMSALRIQFLSTIIIIAMIIRILIIITQKRNEQI